MMDTSSSSNPTSSGIQLTIKNEPIDPTAIKLESGIKSEPFDSTQIKKEVKIEPGDIKQEPDIKPSIPTTRFVNFLNSYVLCTVKMFVPKTKKDVTFG